MSKLQEDFKVKDGFESKVTKSDNDGDRVAKSVASTLITTNYSMMYFKFTTRCAVL